MNELEKVMPFGNIPGLFMHATKVDFAIIELFYESDALKWNSWFIRSEYRRYFDSMSHKTFCKWFRVFSDNNPEVVVAMHKVYIQANYLQEIPLVDDIIHPLNKYIESINVKFHSEIYGRLCIMGFNMSSFDVLNDVNHKQIFDLAILGLSENNIIGILTNEVDSQLIESLIQS